MKLSTAIIMVLIIVCLDLMILLEKLEIKAHENRILIQEVDGLCGEIVDLLVMAKKKK